MTDNDQSPKSNLNTNLGKNPSTNPSTNPSKEDLIPWRNKIDEIDRTIIILLNERAKCASKIGTIKKKLKLPVYVPTREEDVLNNASENNPGPLPNIAVRRLFERIIDETRSLERHLYQEDKDKH